jgi:hypothetical protein
MGLLTDFFISDYTEIHTVDIVCSPITELSGFQAKGIDPVKLLHLLCCIDGVNFTERVPMLDDMCVRNDGPEGPWILQVPQSLCDALVIASPSDLQGYAKAWARTEEWVLEGAIDTVLLSYLGEIAALAISAGKQRRSLYLWMSL